MANDFDINKLVREQSSRITALPHPYTIEPTDPEMHALQGGLYLLTPLDDAARRRVLAYLNARYGEAKS